VQLHLSGAKFVCVIFSYFVIVGYEITDNLLSPHFHTCSMGGLVVKQLLYQAKLNNYDNFLNNTVGLVCICVLNFVIIRMSDLTMSPSQVFYSCPHFGSKLADMPWRMGLVFRPAPSVWSLILHMTSWFTN